MNCHMLQSPRIVLTYIFPLNGHGGFAPKALEFATSYLRNPPGVDHDTVIVCNGAPITQPSKDLFNGMPNLSYLDHDNSGWDIGGFQLAARTIPCDLMVFCGAHTYFRKPGWLARMVEAFNQLGDTLYGSTGNQGDIRFGVYPHVRTTGFWCKPELMANYPLKVTQTGGGGQRYESEHGKECLTNWVKSLGKQVWITGWDRSLVIDDCNAIPNGFHQGDQSNVLVGDRLTCPPYYHTP